MVEEQAGEPRDDSDSGQRLDRAYAALADPTRRALLVALRAGDARITDLAAPLPMTFAGVSRHVSVLESAGLVRRVGPRPGALAVPAARGARRGRGLDR